MAEFKEEVRNVLAEAKKKGPDNLSQEELLAILARIDALLNKMGTAPKALMRFTTLRELIVMFQRGGLVLHDAGRWSDQVDRAYMARGVREVGAKKYGVMCFYGVEEDAETATFETTAHWGTYSSQNAANHVLGCLDYGIAIEFDPRWLNAERINEKLVDKQGYEARMEKIDYIDFGSYCKLEGDWFFKKRRAYRWEREWRLVVTSRSEATTDEIFVPMCSCELDQMIKKVVYSPNILRRCPKRDGRELDLIKKNVEDALQVMNIEAPYYDVLKRILLEKNESNRSGVLDNANAILNALPEEGNIPCPYRTSECDCCKYRNEIKVSELCLKTQGGK